MGLKVILLNAKSKSLLTLRSKIVKDVAIYCAKDT
jgi:hypothetical protein